MFDTLKRDTADQIAQQAAKIAALELQRNHSLAIVLVPLKSVDCGTICYETTRR